MLFVSAKINQYSKLPQGRVEHDNRVDNMISQMDDEGFGSCTNTGACEVDCPKEISINNIVKLNKSFLKNLLS
jgi:succinate dehydrogenase / fumarate reductase iron-sulfur subunit